MSNITFPLKDIYIYLTSEKPVNDQSYGVLYRYGTNHFRRLYIFDIIECTFESVQKGFFLLYFVQNELDTYQR